MKHITRKEAVAQGLKKYYIGPCRTGHDCERYVNGGCITCSRKLNRLYCNTDEYKAQRREVNKTPEYRAKNATRQAEYRKAHPEYVKRANAQSQKINKQRYRNDPEYRENLSRWNKENKEHVNKMQKVRYANDKDYFKLLGRLHYYTHFALHNKPLNAKQTGQLAYVTAKIEEIRAERRQS